MADPTDPAAPPGGAARTPPAPSALTRRRLLSLGAAGLAGGAASLLSGCATPGTTSVNTQPTIPAAGEPVRLQYWAWLKDLQKVCDIWNAQRPDIQVEAVWIPGGNSGGYQKLFAASAAGGSPDLAQVEFRSIPEFMLVNALVDLSRYGVDQYADRYNKALWQQVSYVDGVYGIPQDSGPMALYYRPDLLQRVGAEPPATWDEWAELAAEVRKIGAYLDVFAVSDASGFCAYATQAGATWFAVDGDHWTVNMTDEATLNTAAFFDKAIDRGLVSTAFTLFSPPWYAAAANNQIAGAVTASWGDALIESVSGGAGKWKVAPMPLWQNGSQTTGYGSSFIGGSTAAVMADSKHPKEAMEFAVWMTTSRAGIDAMIANSGIGWSPTDSYIGATRQQPSEFFSGQNYNEDVFVKMATEQNPDWQWWPLTTQSFNILADAFRRKGGSYTLVDAVRDAEGQIIEAFRNKGLSIERRGLSS